MTKKSFSSFIITIKIQKSERFVCLQCFTK